MPLEVVGLALPRTPSPPEKGGKEPRKLLHADGWTSCINARIPHTLCNYVSLRTNVHLERAHAHLKMHRLLPSRTRWRLFPTCACHMPGPFSRASTAQRSRYLPSSVLRPEVSQRYGKPFATSPTAPQACWCCAASEVVLVLPILILVHTPKYATGLVAVTTAHCSVTRSLVPQRPMRTGVFPSRCRQGLGTDLW
jgi:hypothetical protein